MALPPAKQPVHRTPAAGGRRWWAHIMFTRMNIGPTILRNQIEELMNVQGIGEASFLKLKSLVAIAPAKTAER
jgi:hypothetical protein